MVVLPEPSLIGAEQDDRRLQFLLEPVDGVAQGARIGTVHPGKYLVLVGGDVACVEESYAAGLDAGREAALERAVESLSAPETPSLEELFLDLVGGEPAAEPPGRRPWRTAGS